MILSVFVDLKRLFDLQQKFPWRFPKICPSCRQGPVWGHGFVLAYFDGLPSGVYLRRFRCPHCRCVMRTRPAGFFSRFQASIATIVASLRGRLKEGRYLPGLSINRQRYWLNNLKRKVKALLGNLWDMRLLEGFDRLLSRGQIPVSSSMQAGITVGFWPTYRRLP